MSRITQTVVDELFTLYFRAVSLMGREIIDKVLTVIWFSVQFC